MSETRKVVIIGSGGAGLAALSSMLRAGFEVELLEKSHEIGGIWSTTKYPNLTIHSKSFNYRYLDFQSLSSKGERATREEILDYMNRFVASLGGDRHIRFNVEVERIVYRPGNKSRKCEVHARDLTTGQHIEIACDFVVCALGFTNGGRPHKPTFKGAAAFKGTIIHSSEFTQHMLDDVLKNKRKVVVYGAGKSSHEILSIFEGSPKTDVSWIYKKSLWALSYEKLYDNRKMYRFMLMFSYYLFLCGLRRKIGRYNWLLYALERPLIWRGIFLNPLEPAGNIFQNRMAIMPAQQYEYLKSVKSAKAEILDFTENELRLSNGQAVPADYVICATGYERASNMPKVVIAQNGSSVEYDYTAQHSFYLNMIDPKLPEIGLLASNILYSQQIFGFSIGAEWLARFFSGRLANGPSNQKMETVLLKQKSAYSAWCSDQFLSKGGAYYFDRDTFALSRVLGELGLEKKTTRQLLMYSTHEEIFNKVCSRINLALHG